MCKSSEESVCKLLGEANSCFDDVFESFERLLMRMENFEHVVSFPFMKEYREVLEGKRSAAWMKERIASESFNERIFRLNSGFSNSFDNVMLQMKHLLILMENFDHDGKNPFKMEFNQMTDRKRKTTAYH